MLEPNEWSYLRLPLDRVPLPRSPHDSLALVGETRMLAPRRSTEAPGISAGTGKAVSAWPASSGDEVSCHGQAEDCDAPPPPLSYGSRQPTVR